MVFLVSVIVFTGFSKVLLKVGANRANGNKFIIAYVNLYTLIAYSMYMLTTLLTVYALKDILLNLFLCKYFTKIRSDYNFIQTGASGKDQL
jgi:hypothetical protein